jgi:ABC-type glycerol-3-phosphate transport system permease component
MAVSALLLVPILLVFTFAQRYFIAGLTAGAVKG